LEQNNKNTPYKNAFLPRVVPGRNGKIKTMKSRLVYRIIFILIFLRASELFGCTIFSLSDSTQSLMGNSEDYWEKGYMNVTQGDEKGYGRITFSFANKYVQGGINEHGLAIDGTGAIKEMQMVVDPSVPELQLSENIVDIILKKCKNADEAVDLCRKYNLLVLKNCHIMFTDASGKSVIVVLDKEGYTQYLTKKGNYQLITNFNPLNPEVGYYPCERYDTASTMLPNLSPDIWRAADVLNAVKQDGGKETHYGQVYDCAKKKFYLFRNQNYLQALVFDVETLLKGKNYRIKLDLLPKLENFVFPSGNASISSINNSISLQAESGDYKLIVAKSDKFENPLAFNILPYEIVKSSFGLIGIFLLILCIPKARVRILPLTAIILLLVSCVDNVFEKPKGETKNYRVQIDETSGLDTGTWYWKIEGKTNSGYSFETKPLCFTIE